ncbi:F0F1 ATP synthase subunit B family protein [Kitasatospora sp. NPDC004240]
MQNIGPLKPELPELLLGLAVFFLIFGVLGRVLLPRIEEVLASRHDATVGGSERAEAIRTEAAQTLADYRRELLEAQHAAARIRQEASEQGAAIIAAAREEGLRERERLVADAHARIAVDQALAAVSLRQDVGELAVELAERVVGEPLAALAAERGTVDRFFDERLDAKS